MATVLSFSYEFYDKNVPILKELCVPVSEEIRSGGC